MNLGVFWPTEVYEEREKKRLLNDEQDLYNFMGRKLKGIVRDAVHGSPPGTITFTYVQITQALRSREVERGDQACRQGRLDDTWKAMTSAVSVSSKKLML